MSTNPDTTPEATQTAETTAPQPAENAAKPPVETADAQPVETTAGEPQGDVDVVAAISYRADGTPDQTPGFVHLLAEQDPQPAADEA